MEKPSRYGPGVAERAQTDHEGFEIHNLLLPEVGCGGMGWIELAQDRNR